MSNTVINVKLDFKLYLEGIRTEFASASIRESEGDFPQFSFSVPATASTHKILKSTKVHFFGPDPVTEKPVLLFEGEITALNYSKNAGSRIVTFSAVSSLFSITKATTYPLATMVTPQIKMNTIAGSTVVAIAGKKDDSPLSSLELVYGAVKSAIDNGLALIKNKDDIKKELNSADIYSFENELVDLLNDDEVVGGDFSVLVDTIFKKFQLLDLIFGRDSVIYRYLDTIFTVPNTGKGAAFFNDGFQQLLQGFLSSVDRNIQNSETLKLIDFLNYFLRQYRYTMNMPSAPTSSFLPLGDGDETQVGPMRMFLLPHTDNSPPALCNLFFPHDVMGLSSTRATENEPTRFLGTTSLGEFDNSALTAKGLVDLYILPEILTPDKEAVDNNETYLTPEESIWGINASRSDFSHYLTKALEEDKTLSAEEQKKAKEEREPKKQEALKKASTLEFLKQRMAGRALTLSTTWNPHRLVGLPGAFIDEGDSPTLTGIVSSISSSFDASGNCTSSVTFRSVRTLDLNDRDALTEDMIPSFNLDSYEDKNELLYNTDIYSGDKIGPNIYAYLTEGKIPVDKDNVSWMSTIASKPKKERAFFKRKGKIDSLLKSKDRNATTKKDASILFNLRDKETNEVKLQLEEAFIPEKKVVGNVEYTLKIHQSLRKIKRDYEEEVRINLEKEYSNLGSYTMLLTRRNLLTESDY